MTNLSFNLLIESINQVHSSFQSQSVKAVNMGLTLRNWCIGFYILEFEQNGEDRARYGTTLVANIAQSIQIKGLTAPELSRCRQFYRVYPEILGAKTQELIRDITDGKTTKRIFGLATQELQSNQNQLISFISYTHFVELIKIDNPVKRKYYELLILKAQLNVKNLKREIASLSYERLGMSTDKEAAFAQLAQKITPALPKDIIKSHYFFEFLGINSPEMIEESALELALINHLQQFIIELGNGFCFESRQKRILIGEEYFFVDLVFYHRILKAHVLIELKVDSFSHAHVSQLVTYLNFYKQNMMEDGDNPPIGILLVTDKNTALVEYATANEKDRLFVSKYKLNLPSEQDLKMFIERELQGFDGGDA
jgi:predicted nuclease of restriction endonuclease-like (RecB) superfamily